MSYSKKVQESLKVETRPYLTQLQFNEGVAITNMVLMHLQNRFACTQTSIYKNWNKNAYCTYLHQYEEC